MQGVHISWAAVLTFFYLSKFPETATRTLPWTRKG